MENGDIPDENIQALSETDGAVLQFLAKEARLNASEEGSYWSPTSHNGGEWIQADIGYQTYVTGVVTQGDGGHGAHDWVTSFKVSTFLRNADDQEIFISDEDGNVKVNI